ncbi:MAG: hypothetical protein JWL70_616, partial [Acidimicrobiia bacterium]|nr:hypothetical protein [Acidimicrobiia bacterium]
LEFTDDRLPGDPREGDEAPTPAEAIIAVDGIAWVTAAVADLDAVVEQFGLIFGAEPTFPTSEASSKDRQAEFILGDLTVRLVQPSSDDSPYAESVRSGVGRLHSVALAATDFAGLDAAIERAGLTVVARDPHSVWLDPADMHGIRFELVG